jgi:hypothetical protein
MVLALWSVLPATEARAQRTLGEAVERARSAWLSHDTGVLAASWDSLTLGLPGIQEVTVGSGQAARLLNRYLQPAMERAFEIRNTRTTGEEQGYAEAKRRYVVRGTSDEASEMVYLGFRRTDGRWRLTEIRVTP